MVARAVNFWADISTPFVSGQAGFCRLRLTRIGRQTVFTGVSSAANLTNCSKIWPLGASLPQFLHVTLGHFRRRRANPWR